MNASAYGLIQDGLKKGVCVPSKVTTTDDLTEEKTYLLKSFYPKIFPKWTVSHPKKFFHHPEPVT